MNAGRVPAPGGRVALRRVVTLITTLGTLLTAGLLIGGSSYLSGFERTILAPVAHTSSPLAVLANSWYWAGLLVLLAVCGVIMSWAGQEGRARAWLLAVLASAAVLGPLEEAWLHTAAVLNRHTAKESRSPRPHPGESAPIRPAHHDAPFPRLQLAARLISPRRWYPTRRAGPAPAR